jgi:hypothetical protein
MADQSSSLIAQMMQGVQAQQQDAQAQQAQQEKDELGDLTGNLLKGFLMQTAPGQPVSREEFDQRFRQNMSPAREILANVMMGISSSFTGQKFQAVREQAWQQEQQTEVLRQQAEQQRSQQMIGMMTILQREAEARRQAAAQNELTQIRQISDANTRQMKMLELAMKNHWDEKRFNSEVELNTAKMKQDAEKMEWEKWKARSKNSDPLMDAAVNSVIPQLEAAGLDLTKPENQDQMWKQAFVVYEQLLAKKESTEAKFNPKSERPLRLQLFQVTGEDGKQYSVGVNPYTNQVIGGTKIGTNLNGEKLQKVLAMQQATSSLRMALEFAKQYPQDLGTYANMLSPTIRARLGQLPASERTVRGLFNNAIAEYLRSESGLSMTESERSFLREGVPETFEKPEVFFPAAQSFLVMMEAGKFRTQYGLDLDLTKTLKKMHTHSVEQIKRGNLQGVKIPSTDLLLQDAAYENGVTLVKTPTGGWEIAR